MKKKPVTVPKKKEIIKELNQRSNNMGVKSTVELTRKEALKLIRDNDIVIENLSQDWVTLKEKYNYTCVCCLRSEADIKLSEDHIVPVSKNGSDKIENIQPLCKSCNSSKNKHHSTDYRSTFHQRYAEKLLLESEFFNVS